MAAVVGCSPAKKRTLGSGDVVVVADSSAFDRSLVVDRIWTMEYIEVGGVRLNAPKDEEVSLTFDSNSSRMHGKCCNRYFGAYSFAGNTVSFDKVGSTKMLCVGVLGDIERQYHSLLKQKLTVVVDSTTLVLKSSDGRAAFSLSKASR